jgi:hypothetical protein
MRLRAGAERFRRGLQILASSNGKRRALNPLTMDTPQEQNRLWRLLPKQQHAWMVFP